MVNDTLQNDNKGFNFRRVTLKDRIIARLLDVVQYYVIRFVFGIGLIFFVNSVDDSTLEYLLLIPTGIAYLWFLLRDGLAGGANYGKTNREIMVVMTDSENMLECSIGRSFGRNIVSDISALAIFTQFSNLIPIALAYLIVLAIDIWRIQNSEGGKRIGDILAKTQVVYMDDWVEYQQYLRNQQKPNVTA